jgi:nucleoside-diphosphate-sugar epimerase
LRPAYIVGFKDELYRESILMKRVINNQDIFIPEDGKSRIQFVHKDDLIEICIRLSGDNFKNEIYNVASEEIFTINEWIEFLAKLAGSKPMIRYSPFRDDNRRIFQYSPADIIVDPAKIKQNLNVNIEDCSNKLDFIRNLK